MTEPNVENVGKILTEQTHGFNNESVIENQGPVAITLPTEAGQKAAEQALSTIKDRSYAGRNPELGKMINCAFCGTRHRQNDSLMKCEQKFATETREGDPVQGELLPPEGMATLTARQLIGAAAFAKRRQRPRNKPKNKIHYWLKVIIEAAKRKKDADQIS